MLRSLLSKPFRPQPSTLAAACRIAAFGHLRIANTPKCRSFSASPVRCTQSTAEIVLEVPCKVIDLVHWTGLPWYATIPVVAVLFRGVVQHFISRRGRRHQIRQNRLTPMLSAGARYMKMSGQHDSSFEIRRRASQKYGFPMISWLFIPSFGILIVATEAIRLKCGTTAGLLSLILDTITYIPRWIINNAILGASPSDRDTTAPPPDGALQPAEHNESLLPADPSFFDVTLQTGGLSWCPDLTVPDPTASLPLMLLALTLYRAYINMPHLEQQSRPWRELVQNATKDLRTVPQDGQLHQAPAKPSAMPLSPNESSQQTVHIITSFVISYGFFNFISLNLPAGIMIYLLSSTLVGMLEKVYLDATYPAPKAIMPCKRPLRLKSDPRFSQF